MSVDNAETMAAIDQPIQLRRPCLAASGNGVDVRKR
jgi:hypothetical protein